MLLRLELYKWYRLKVASAPREEVWYTMVAKRKLYVIIN